MYIMKRLVLFVFVGYLVLLLSCEKEVVSASDAGYTKKQNTFDTVLFARDVMPILNANCVHCHDASSSFPLDASSAYSTIMNGYINKSVPDESKFFKNKVLGHPDDYLMPEEHQKIKNWIIQGALNN